MKHTAILLLVIAVASMTALPVFADVAKLAQDKGCIACHEVASKKVGPAYQEVAAKYKNDAGAASALSGKIKAGGSGVWGQIPMPPQTTLSDDEVQTLVKWILSQ